MARPVAVPAGADRVQRIKPLAFFGTSPAPDLLCDTNPDSNSNRPQGAVAAGPSHLVTAVRI